VTAVWIVAVVVGSIIGGMIGRLISDYLNRRRDKMFLRFVRVTLPNAKVIEAITIADSDKKALENIERRLRDASRNL
jgi:hypothetical protein